MVLLGLPTFDDTGSLGCPPSWVASTCPVPPRELPPFSLFSLHFYFSVFPDDSILFVLLLLYSPLSLLAAGLRFSSPGIVSRIMPPTHLPRAETCGGGKRG